MSKADIFIIYIVSVSVGHYPRKMEKATVSHNGNVPVFA
jgi:hypothetical protein